MQHMGDTFRRVAVPALALGAGTGALSGFMSSGAKPGESGGDRRRRILKNAIIGAALGTTAGVGIPMGLQALNTPLHTHTAGPIEGATDTAVGVIGRHPAFFGGGALALWAGRHMDNAGRNRAIVALGNTLSQDKTPGAQAAYRYHKDQMAGNIAGQAATPEGTADLIRQYGKGLDPANTGALGAGMGHIFRANELLREAGQKGLSLAQMQEMLEEKGMNVPGAVRGEFLKHIGGTGMIGRGLQNMAEGGRLPFADTIAKLPGLSGAAEYDPVHLAEMYSKYMRPSVGKMIIPTRLLPPALRWGLLGAGVLGANEIQKRVMGN